MMLARSLWALLGASALGLSACQSPNSAQIDAALANFDQNLKQATDLSAATATKQSESEFQRLPAKIDNHLSLVQYCAFALKFVDASDLSSVNAAKARLKLKEKVEGPVTDAVASVDFGALYPVLRNPPPSFTSKLAGRENVGGDVYFSSETGSCTVMSIREAQADTLTKAWLASSEAGWIQERRGKVGGWSVYKIAQPTLWQSNIRLIRSVLSKDATKAGVTAVDVIAVVGLP
jgi:hypothetical protein